VFVNDERVSEKFLSSGDIVKITKRPDSTNVIASPKKQTSFRARKNRRHCEPGGRGNLPTLSHGFDLHYYNLIEVAASLRSSQ